MKRKENQKTERGRGQTKSYVCYRLPLYTTNLPQKICFEKMQCCLDFIYLFNIMRTHFHCILHCIFAVVESTFTRVLYLSTILRHLRNILYYIMLLHFKKEILYFLLHHIYVTAIATSYFTDKDFTLKIYDKLINTTHCLRLN